MPSVKRTKFDYRNVFLGKGADKYEFGTYKENSYYSLIWELEKEYLKDFLVKNKFKNYLDFACGSGRVISFAEKYVGASTGVDVSKDMLNITKTKVSKAKLIAQDITKSSLNAKYDLITAYRFFLNAQEGLRHDVLKEFQQMTKSGSYVVISNQGNKTSAIFLTAPLEKTFFGKKLNMLSKKDLEKLFNQYGYELVEYRGFGFLPKAFYSIGFLKKPLYALDTLFYKARVFSYLSHNQTLIFKPVK